MAFIIFLVVACKLLAAACGIWFVGFVFFFLKYLFIWLGQVLVAKVFDLCCDPQVPLVWCAGPSVLFNID